MLNWLPVLFLLIAQGACTTGEAPSRTDVWAVLSAAVQAETGATPSPTVAPAEVNAPTLAFWAHWIAAADAGIPPGDGVTWAPTEGEAPPAVTSGPDAPSVHDGFSSSARTRDGPRTV